MDEQDQQQLRRWVGLGGLALVVVILVTIIGTPNDPDATSQPGQGGKVRARSSGRSVPQRVCDVCHGTDRSGVPLVSPRSCRSCRPARVDDWPISGSPEVSCSLWAGSSRRGRPSPWLTSPNTRIRTSCKR